MKLILSDAEVRLLLIEIVNARCATNFNALTFDRSNSYLRGEIEATFLVETPEDKNEAQ